jgi:hypothetical protein
MTPRDVILAYPTWIITLLLSAIMNWALSPSSRTTDDIFADILRNGFSTAVGLAGAAFWWEFWRRGGGDITE